MMSVPKRSAKNVKLFPKTIAKWRESKKFVRLRYEHDTCNKVWWHSLIGVSTVTILSMGLWYLAHFNPKKDPVDFNLAIALSVILGLFIFCIVPRLFKYTPSEVRITDCGIIPSGSSLINWSDISSIKSTIKFKSRVLLVRLNSGREIVLEAELIEPNCRLEDIFTQYQVSYTVD